MERDCSVCDIKTKGNINGKPLCEVCFFELYEMHIYENKSKATDGCIVEPDGTCKHGRKSWLLELGMI